MPAPKRRSVSSRSIAHRYSKAGRATEGPRFASTRGETPNKAELPIVCARVQLGRVFLFSWRLDDEPCIFVDELSSYLKREVQHGRPSQGAHAGLQAHSRHCSRLGSDPPALLDLPAVVRPRIAVA